MPKESEKKSNCTVRGCYADKQTGDSLFCNECRTAWRVFAVVKGFAYPEDYYGKNAEYFEEHTLPNYLMWFQKYSIQGYGGKQNGKNASANTK